MRELMPLSASPRSSLVLGFAQVAVAILMGAGFWPVICELGQGFGASGAFHDAMLVTAIVAGGVGGFLGLVVARSFGTFGSLRANGTRSGADNSHARIGPR